MPKRRRRDQDGIYERSDSPYYWASYIDASGQRVRCSTGVRKSIEGRKEAEALLAKWRVEQHRSQHWKDQPPKTFDELMVEYLKATESKRSASKDRQRCKTLRRFFGGRIMNDLVPVDIRRYIALRRKEKISDSTINRETALLSAAINYANREWDWQLPNPAKGRRLAEPEGRVRWLTRAEAGVLLQQAEKDSQARQWLPEFIRLALNTGAGSRDCWGWNGRVWISRRDLSTWRPSTPRGREGVQSLLTLPHEPQYYLVRGSGRNGVQAHPGYSATGKECASRM